MICVDQVAVRAMVRDAIAVERYGKQGMFAWNEADHPRETDGTFARKDGGSNSSSGKPIHTLTRAEFHTQERSKSGYDAAAANKVYWGEVTAAIKAGKDDVPEESRQFATKHFGATPDERDTGIPSAAEVIKMVSEQFAADAAGPKIESPAEAFSQAVETGETPQQAAAKATRAAGEAEYAFARTSAVPNAGEDLKGSARHKVNQWRGLAEAERDGTAEAMVTRDNLLKAEPHGLMKHADKHPLTALAMYFAMRAFPAKPGYGTDKQRSRRADSDAKKDREQFLETYREYKAKAEVLAETEPDPVAAISKLQVYARTRMHDLRGVPADKRQSSHSYAFGTDQYNGTANQMAELISDLTTSHRAPKNGVAAKLAGFSDLAKSTYGGSLPSADKLTEHAKDVIEGRSVPSTFGASKAAKKGFDASDLYVKHAVRVGGRDVSQHTRDANAAVDWLVNTMDSRGVQWGNSVTDDERKHHAEKLVEAMVDLADVTGLKPEDLTLGGRLGWAIGARGHGTASAHYEPGNQVINLTRKSGAGALSHEWAHAFDHSHSGFAIIDNGDSSVGDYESERAQAESMEWDRDAKRHRRVSRSDDPRFKAYQALREAWEKSGFDKRLRSVVAGMFRNGELSEAKVAYWTSRHEKFARTFERFVQQKLRKEGRDNTYLSGLMPQLSALQGAELWPTDDEVEHMTPAFEALLAQYRQQKYGDSAPQKYSRCDLYSRVRSAVHAAMVERYELSRDQAVEHLKSIGLHVNEAAIKSMQSHIARREAKERGEAVPAEHRRVSNIPADPPKPAVAAKSSNAQKPSNGSWQKVGGSSVFVNNDGQITKGCPGLKGEHVSDLIGEEEESRARREARQDHAASQGKTGHDLTASQAKRLGTGKALATHQVAKKAAKATGVPTHEVLKHMPEVQEMESGTAADTERARARARQMTGLTAGRINRMEDAGKDHASVPHFDEISREFAAEHPHLFDKDGDDTPQQVWEFIKQGRQETKLAPQDLADKAADRVWSTRQSLARKLTKALTETMSENQSESDDSGLVYTAPSGFDDEFDKFSRRLSLR